VQTGSRLHFGLLNPGEGPFWADREGRPVLPARRFGGVGLMIDEPGVCVRVEPAGGWSAEGPLAGRALHFAQEFARGLEPEPAGGGVGPARLVVETAPREHAGLGSGTQLGLAVARALAGLWGIDLSVAELARRVQRGGRSGLGVHGFERGGLLVDAGKLPGVAVAPLVARLPFPEHWRILVAIPPAAPGLHGPGEQAAFERLAAPAGTCEALCRLILLGMLPAVAEADLRAFGEALYDFNARVGELFAPAQGGTYAGPAVAELIGFIRRQGVAGVAQSSWGPGVSSVVEEEQANDLAGRIRHYLGPAADVWVSRARNEGARVTGGP
jgi:beta-RFAP synthase